MYERYFTSQRRLETVFGLGCKTNFWNDDQCLLTPCYHLLNTFDVDLSFSAACYSLEQMGFEARHLCLQRAANPLLCVSQVHCRLRRVSRRFCSFSFRHARFDEG